MRPTVLVFLWLLLSFGAFSQQPSSRSSTEPSVVSNKSLQFINSKYEKLNTSLQKQSQKMLARMQRKEAKLKKQLSKKDSAAATQLFGEAETKYTALQHKLSGVADTTANNQLTEYIPGLDSLQTAFAFLKQGNGAAMLPTDKLQQLNAATASVKELQTRMQQATDVQSFVRQREQQLKEKLQNTPLAKQLKGINKEVYYYQQRLTEYKELINDQKKLEQKAMQLVRDLPAFKNFWQKHSYLSQLFPMPANYGTPAALSGLQTRAGVQAQLQQRFGMSNFTPGAAAGGGGSGGNYLQQQMQDAQTQLSTLKDKLNKLGIDGGSSDITMPDFKPNNQHTKSFLKRIELGANLQSQQGKNYLPVTSDIALTAGYKLNDKATIGTGVAYKLGWGSDWKHIKLTNEGIGLRSYLDMKLPKLLSFGGAEGGLWITGGYEMNYMQSFKKLQDIRDVSMWQRSGLVGITKKYKIGKQENNIQLLWDFLSYSQVPRGEAIKFRVGVKL